MFLLLIFCSLNLCNIRIHELRELPYWRYSSGVGLILFFIKTGDMMLLSTVATEATWTTVWCWEVIEVPGIQVGISLWQNKHFPLIFLPCSLKELFPGLTYHPIFLLLFLIFPSFLNHSFPNYHWFSFFIFINYKGKIKKFIEILK